MTYSYIFVFGVLVYVVYESLSKMPINVMSYLRPANGNKWFLLEDSFIKGGLKVVGQLIELDSLDRSSLVQGALVYVEQERAVYEFQLDQNAWNCMYKKPIEIAVVGDSISSEYSAYTESWPAILQDKLNNMGASVRVKNAAIGGSTFTAALTKSPLNSSDASFKFGNLSQVEYACADNPDVIIVMLGFNDVSQYVSDAGVNTVDRQKVYTDASALFATLRTKCPNATIICVHELMYDTTNFNVNTAKNKHVIPFMWNIDKTVGMEDTRNQALGEQLASQRSRDHVVELSALYAHLMLETSSIDRHIDLDYWRILRLGTSTIDLLHPDSTGMLLQATEILNDLVVTTKHTDPSAPIFHSINLRDYAQDTLAALVSNTLVQDGDGYKEVAGTLFNYFVAGSPFELNPKLWWSPIRPKIEISNYAANDQVSIKFSVTGAVPFTDIWMSSDAGITWFDAGKIDENGSYFLEREPRQLLLAPGQAKQVYVKLQSPLLSTQTPYGWEKPCVFGPYPIQIDENYQQRIVVIGDSMSTTYTDSGPAWPEILQEKMNGLGANVKVFNVSLDNSTFSSSFDPAHLSYPDWFSFGKLTKLQYAISLNPDVVIVQLGMADCKAVVDIVTGITDQEAVDAVHSSVDSVFTTLRQQLPNAIIIYSKQVLHDVAHWSQVMPKNKHFALPVHWSTRSDNTVLSGATSAQNCEEVLPDYAKGVVRELNALHTYVLQNHAQTNIDQIYATDYFKVARMGGLSSDLARPNGGGKQLLASQHFKNLQSVQRKTDNALVFPFIAKTNWNLMNSFDALFNNALTNQSDGYFEDFGSQFNFARSLGNGFEASQLDPYYWWCPCTPNVVFNKKLNGWPFLQIVLHGLPGFANVSLSLDGSTWSSILGLANSSGSLMHVEPLPVETASQFSFYIGFTSPSWDSLSSAQARSVVLGPYYVIS